MPNIQTVSRVLRTALSHFGRLVCAAGLLAACGCASDANRNGRTAADYSVAGNLKKWQAVAIAFHGPTSDAADSQPNPFLDYRLQVVFHGPNGKKYDVPGFFDGDGQGGRAGTVWRVLFSPDETGRWQFKASFRKGPQVAVSLDANAGEPVAFDGAQGSFVVKLQNPNAPGYLKWGRLEYVGKFYLKFRDGPYWLKGGTDEPEDFLGYVGFTNTPKATHRFTNHVQDWRPGDPDWDGGKGKAIIGALNYLSSQHMNNLYFLPMNIGGDGKNAWPYLGPINPKGAATNDNLHFDLAKLRQWETVLDHAQRRSIFLHFVLNEAEAPNKKELDDGTLGVERKIYYRELIARFGHHLALQWNLCEEYDLDFKLEPDVVKSFAEYIQAVDPYDHPITVHQAGKPQKTWIPFLGFRPFTVTSFQTRDMSVVEFWRKASRAAGWPQVVHMDEVFPDNASAATADRHRREYTWPIYLSGGDLECILDELIKTDDYRKYETVWSYTWFARKFLEENLPFWEMEPMDHLLTGAETFQGKHNLVTGQVFAKPGEVYAIYVPDGSSPGTLDLSAARGKFVQRWYNPRTGEFDSSSKIIEGGKMVALGSSPSEVAEDWAILISRTKRDLW
ncbi:MAG: DUF5060 domain-containing protein [Pedosphaera sp.]|nr:DUF5060 domain-containing protein [Pedosphaera sp.]